jgi:hypothetical protein
MMMMMMIVEQSEECSARKSEVLGGNLLQCFFPLHKSHMTLPGLEPGLPRWEAGD